MGTSDGDDRDYEPVVDDEEPSFDGEENIDNEHHEWRSWVAEFAFRHMESKDVASWNILLNEFILRDDLEYARLVFDGMPQRNSITWNAMSDELHFDDEAFGLEGAQP
ncbi:pentatricopeptide repeat-containing protein [Tripterygium wilfordii]|uniref:Pentatricopeptide repeat-containing protein n=1 Tax=Tripterygium wilfordii TaxID=458696 RepID=A0A7J7DHV7_TRIWF|nr:pentatricopeptide repeat-containing protein [Tripterygium wilfordii]